MRARPVSFDALVDDLADRIAAAPREAWQRVALDGAPPAAPGRLADRLVEPLRLRGREVLRVRADDFLRAASLRLERGRRNPEAFYEDWLDVGALRREVLNPLAPGGTGRVLPALWNAATDRSYRRPYVTLPPGAVVLVDGTLLLGRGLPFDLTVHLWLSPAALARLTGPEERWRPPRARTARTRAAATAPPARYGERARGGPAAHRRRGRARRRPAASGADHAGVTCPIGGRIFRSSGFSLAAPGLSLSGRHWSASAAG